MAIAGGIAAALLACERTGEPSEVYASLLQLGVWATALSVDIALLLGDLPAPPPLSAVLTPFNSSRGD